MSQSDETVTSPVWIVPSTSKSVSEQRYHSERDCRQLQRADNPVRAVPLPDAEVRERDLCQVCAGHGPHGASGRVIVCPHCGDKWESLGRHVPCPEGPDASERDRGGVSL